MKKLLFSLLLSACFVPQLTTCGLPDLVTDAEDEASGDGVSFEQIGAGIDSACAATCEAVNNTIEAVGKELIETGKQSW